MTAEQIEKGIRLGRFISTRFRTQKAFAEAIGVTQGFVSQMISGKSGIPVEVIEKISDTNIGLNPIWLLSGKGEMFLEKKEEAESALAARQVGEDRAGGLGALLEELFSLIGEYEKNMAALEARMAAIEEKMRERGG